VAVAVAGGLLLPIRLRFHNHAPQQLAIRLPFHQQAADKLGCDHLSGTSEEGLRKVLGERGGYGSGLGVSGHIAAPGTAIRLKPLRSYLITQGNCFLEVSASTLIVT